MIAARYELRAGFLLLVALEMIWATSAMAVSLASRVNYATGGVPFDVVFGDFNGDGKLDMAVSNSNATTGNTISVRLGDGSGGFGSKSDYSAGSRPLGLATGDLNGDNKLDLVTANFITVGTVAVLMGNGDGTFGSATTYATRKNPRRLLLSDFNSDGDLDVAVTGDSTTISILLGNGDGTLGTYVEWSAGAQPEDLAAGDINADGDVDVVTANNGTTYCSILLGNGDGTFDSPSTLSSGETIHEGVALGDANRDGVLDVAVGNSTSVSIRLGSGSGSFGSATNYTVGDGPENVKLVDLDGDGQLDIFTANFGISTISILAGNGAGSFAAKTDFVNSGGAGGSAIGDLNADGRLDIAATAGVLDDSVSVFLNTSPTLPNYMQSYFVPQAGSVGSPTEGTSAVAYFRACPNNDSGSLPNNARIKVVLLDTLGNPISGVSAADICVVFNGGTAAQDFSGSGADSVIANSTYNQSPLCPDVTCLAADANTDGSGVTYITFHGATPGSPGVASRDSTRKWGHYDSKLPVFVEGIELDGRLTSGASNGTYTLQIKNLDFEGGLGTTMNVGEAVTSSDYNSLVAHLNESDSDDPKNWWRDFNSDGTLTTTEFNLISTHQGHDCDSPNNP